MLESGAQGWSELVDELVALAAQEGLGLRLARLEDDDRLAAAGWNLVLFPKLGRHVPQHLFQSTDRKCTLLCR